MSTPAQLEAFFDRQRELLARERQAEIDQSSLLISNCSPKLLERRGLALLGLGVSSLGIGLGGKSLIELERPSAHHSTPNFPPHSFRSGDLARIAEGSTSNQAPRSKASKAQNEGGGIEGVVYKVSSTKIVIAVDNPESSKSDELDIPEHCWLVKLANMVTFDRKAMDQAVERMAKIMLGSSDSSTSVPSANALQRVLFGLSNPSEPEDIGEIQYFNATGLNPSQKRAVNLALSSPELALIHGPPGTGKTHTLVEIILQLVAKQKKVLVCGASNLAVDNILERLVPHKIPLLRLGHPARVLSDLQGITLDAQAERSDEAQLLLDVKKDIDNLMNMMAGGPKGKRVRGAERKKMWEEVRALRKEYRKREGTVVSRVVNKTMVVVATCHGAGGRQLFNRSFDVVIIDEAAQALEAVCWIPILKTSKLILAGDSLQLPPTVISSKKVERGKRLSKSIVGSKPSTKVTQKPRAGQSKSSAAPTADQGPELGSDISGSSDAEEVPGVSAGNRLKPTGRLVPSKSLETTLFDRMESMWGERIKQMLDIQYRMNETICKYPSITLYGSKLTSDPSVATRLLSDANEDKDAVQDTLGHPVVFFDTSGCEFYERVDNTATDASKKGLSDEGSKCNTNEVEVVRSWVAELVACQVPPAEIAIITPYQAQLSLLSDALLPTYPGLEIGTVDGMQGREKDAVIISLVRSNDKREVGFLKEKRRLNVAMTRARKHLCVVGDSGTVRHGSRYLKSWMKWLEENADVRFAGEP